MFNWFKKKQKEYFAIVVKHDDEMFIVTVSNKDKSILLYGTLWQAKHKINNMIKWDDGRLRTFSFGYQGSDHYDARILQTTANNLDKIITDKFYVNWMSCGYFQGFEVKDTSIWNSLLPYN